MSLGRSVIIGITTGIERWNGRQPARVRMMPTTTDKIPNTSATAASSGADLNGGAVRNACIALRERILPVAAATLAKKWGVAVSASKAGA